MKNRNKVSLGVITTESITVPKLGRRSISNRWIPFKFLKEGGPSDLIVDKKNAQKRKTDLRHQIQSSLDHEGPTRSLKCKEKWAHKILKEGGLSIFRQDTW